MNRLECWLAYTHPMAGLPINSSPASWAGSISAQRPRAAQGPPSVQSPFASRRRYRREEGMSCLLEGRYPFVFARTGSCARPVALPPAVAWPRTAGLCSLLPAAAGHRPFPTLSLPILPCVSGPLLRRLPGCAYPFLPPGHWPSPSLERVGVSRRPGSDFCRGSFSKLQSFANVQTRRFARHSGRSHLTPCGARQPWLLHPRPSWFVASPRSGHAIRPNPGN